MRLIKAGSFSVETPLPSLASNAVEHTCKSILFVISRCEAKLKTAINSILNCFDFAGLNLILNIWIFF